MLLVVVDSHDLPKEKMLEIGVSTLFITRQSSLGYFPN